MRWVNCIKGDLERVGGEWRTTAKVRRSWRKVRRGKKTRRNDNGNHGQTHP